MLDAPEALTGEARVQDAAHDLAGDLVALVTGARKVDHPRAEQAAHVLRKVAHHAR